ncbi:MAG TPA: hypothetical protein VK664_09420 [Flavitalea sp.]|nr:hypothetical protein [Flavitalea sp.]
MIILDNFQGLLISLSLLYSRSKSRGQIADGSLGENRPNIVFIMSDDHAYNPRLNNVYNLPIYKKQLAELKKKLLTLQNQYGDETGNIDK